MTHILEQIAGWFADFPAWLATLMISTLPIGELRGGIPIGITIYGMAPMDAFLWAVIGNAIPVFFILWWLPPLSIILSERSPLAKKFFDWLFERTKRKFYDKHDKWGNFALYLFVAIPFPLTGAWTGSLAAFIFGIPKTKALPLIYFGMITAGAIVTLTTMGVLTLF